jgi:predicted phage tail protein
MQPYKKAIVKFHGNLSEKYQETVLYGLHTQDILLGLGQYYPDFNRDVFVLIANQQEFKLTLNGVTLDSLDSFTELFTLKENVLEITPIIVLEGNTLGNILLGVGFGILALTGVGFLGISATTFGLLGASLIFSSIFKSPVTDNKKDADKRSINFSGTINVVGGTQPVPLCFGMGTYCGSIVVSADLVATSRPI